mgnify:CR=1 FL=1
MEHPRNAPYDGLTVELIYDGGELIQASTRGDGYVIFASLESLMGITSSSPSSTSQSIQAILRSAQIPLSSCLTDPAAKLRAFAYGFSPAGSVMKYDSISYSKQKGGTSHHNNDGIAFKFEATRPYPHTGQT